MKMHDIFKYEKYDINLAEPRKKDRKSVV